MPHLPASPVLQLEAESIGRGNRSLHSELDRLFGYSNPPWNLIGRVLAKVEKQKANVVLVAPVWSSQPWYPRLLSLLVKIPRQITPQVNLFQELREGCLPELLPQLAVWPFSGDTTKSSYYRQRLLTSFCSSGGPSLHSRMTHSTRGGLAGVWN